MLILTVRLRIVLHIFSRKVACILFSNGVYLSCSGLLENLCYALYDALRPVIIHTNHLETLADICTILKVQKYDFVSIVLTSGSNFYSDYNLQFCYENYCNGYKNEVVYAVAN